MIRRPVESSRSAGAVTRPSTTASPSPRRTASAIDVTPPAGADAVGCGEPPAVGRGRRRGTAADEVARVARPDAVAVRGALAGRTLSGDAGDLVLRPDRDGVGGQTARGIGDDPDGTLRARDEERDVAAGRLRRPAFDGPDDTDEGALGRLAERRGVDRPRRRQRALARRPEPGRGRSELELAVRIRERSGDGRRACRVAVRDVPSGRRTAMPPVASAIAMSGGVPRRPASAMTTPATETTGPDRSLPRVCDRHRA